MVLICSISAASPSATIFAGVSAIANSGLRRLVDAGVGRLRREHDGDQQREGVDVGELGLRRRRRAASRSKMAAVRSRNLAAPGRPVCLAPCAIYMTGLREPPQRSRHGQRHDAALFEDTLTPHRSLNPRGFRVLMLATCGATTALSVPFYLMGAWPIVGFFGLDVLGDLFRVPRQFPRRAGSASISG